MTTPKVIIKSLREAGDLLSQDRGSAIKHMISIGDPQSEPPLNWKTVPNVLRLEFDDVERDDYDHYKHPTPTDVRKIIIFAEQLAEEGYDGPLLVHCYAGISRSSAAAFICECVWRGEGEESAALDHIYQINHRAHPNTLMVADADNLLNRKGKMVMALAENPMAKGVQFPNLLMMAK